MVVYKIFGYIILVMLIYFIVATVMHYLETALVNTTRQMLASIMGQANMTMLRRAHEQT